jgi:hypothetical protein
MFSSVLGCIRCRWLMHCYIQKTWNRAVLFTNRQFSCFLLIYVKYYGVSVIFIWFYSLFFFLLIPCFFSKHWSEIIVWHLIVNEFVWFKYYVRLDVFGWC